MVLCVRIFSRNDGQEVVVGLLMLTVKSSDSAPSSRLIRLAGDTSCLHFVARTSWASLPLVAYYDTRDTKRLAYTL